MSKQPFSDIRVAIDKDNLAIYRNENLCIKCGACKSICKYNVCVYDNYNLDKVEKPICIGCGQCLVACPTNSISEVKDYLKVKKILKSDKTVIFQIAPSVRVALGEEFGMEEGINVSGKIVSALKKIGADYVFDTTFGADLTIMEEASELVERLKNKKKMPMFTSCCPAWVRYAEIFYPEILPHLSTAKSPILMQGAVIKSYFAKLKNIKNENIISIAVTPCTAKKMEIKRKEFNNDVDYAITTKELAMLIKEENIDFNNLKESNFDEIMETGSGAGVIFGASGGVMQAALRTAYFLLNKKEPNNNILNLEEIKGLGNIKETTVDLNSVSLKVAVVNGTGDAKKLIEAIKNGQADYDFVEVMACEGGCVAGAGQPRITYPVKGNNKLKRMATLYDIDSQSSLRCSYQNKDIIRIYKDFLNKPLSYESKELLHTTYEDKSSYLNERENV